MAQRPQSTDVGLTAADLASSSRRLRDMMPSTAEEAANVAAARRRIHERMISVDEAADSIRRLRTALRAAGENID